MFGNSSEKHYRNNSHYRHLVDEGFDVTIDRGSRGFKVRAVKRNRKW